MNLRPHGLLFEEEKGNGAGGGGAGEDKGGKGEGEKGADHSETLLRGLAVVAKGISDMQESNKELLEFMKAQAEKGGGRGDRGQGDGGEGGGAPKGSLFEGVDMEQLDRKDFAALLLSKFEERLSHHMKEAVKPLEERVGKVSERLENDLAGREVNAAAGERPDFYEWRPEIAALVKENPSLSVTRAYTIARSENAEKATAMDKKYAKKSESKAEGFVGLSPTGGGGRGEGATKMKFSEAAEKAYADVLASLGGVSLDQLPVVGGKR